MKKNKLSESFFSILFSLDVIFPKYNKKRSIYFYRKLFSNAKQGSVIVEIQDIPGTFEIDVRSHILRRVLLNKNYEPEITKLIKQNCRENKDAINIGANIGIFSILLANLINKDCKVLAVEPTPVASGYLVNNIKRNKVEERVLVYKGLCSDKPGEYNLNIVEGKEEYSTIGESSFHNNISENVITIKIPGETVDNLVEYHGLNPGILVIDVEGAEMKVLSGASKMLEKYKPVIITELVDDFLVKQGDKSSDLILFLENLGYTVRSTNNHKISYPFKGNIIAIATNSEAKK